MDGSPVIAGLGQVANKDDGRIVHPMDLLEEAARLALEDASLPAGKVGGIYATPLSALAESDSAGMLADRIGAAPGPRLVSSYSGAGPQRLLAAACQAVADGAVDVALVVGGIADASVRRARRLGVDPPALPTSVWSQGSDRPPGLPERSWGDLYIPEVAAGAGLPSSYFALVQSVIDQGRSRPDQAARLGRLLAPFTEVASRRPSLAWFPSVRTPEEIAAATDANRMVAEPYTKLMCSFPTVDMAAALVVTPAHLARQPAIRPVALTRAPEAGPPSGWAAMDRPIGLRMAVEEAFRLSASTPDDASAFDLYSCFPAAVMVAMDALGLQAADPRRLTASGGLPYFGGPGASYSLHGLACLFEDMRRDGRGTGVAVGVGGMLTDFSVGVYSFDGGPFRRADLPGPEHPAVPVTPTATGPATVEAMTVLHDRDHGPVEAPVIARLPSGARTGARCAEASMPADLAGRSLVGAEVELTTTGGRVVYRLR